MEELRKAVDELLRLRDTWIPQTTKLTVELLAEDPVTAFPIDFDFTSLIREVVSSAEEKPEQLSQRVYNILELATTALSSSIVTSEEKARILLLKGKALNAIAAITQDSTDVKSTLQKALHLDPKLSDAWCEIGEFDWMTAGAESAMSSLTEALKIDVRFCDFLPLIDFFKSSNFLCRTCSKIIQMRFGAYRCYFASSRKTVQRFENSSPKQQNFRI